MASDSSRKTPADLDLTSAGFMEKSHDLGNSSGSDTPFSAPFNNAATKKLLRKLDIHLIPFLAIIYLLCFLDRTNVGNARLVHMEKDLHMQGLQYNNALAILFPFYVSAEIPSNMMLKKFRPSVWFTVIMVAWAIVMISMGFVRSYHDLLICRAFLGVAEGGLFPGINYFITMWYKRHECGFRMAMFFSAATAAGAFGGLFARCIAAMDGVGGYAGWRWIFILEGAFTLCVGSFSYWVVKDYPATAKFLTSEEKMEVERRLVEDNDGLSDEFHVKYAYRALKDWKIWVNCFITLGVASSLYSIALFLPTIVKELGYSNNAAQLMTVPIYVGACGCTVASNWFADKSGQRGLFMLPFELLAIFGFTLLVVSSIPHVQYAGAFLAACGIFSLVPMIAAWNANNIGGTLKRGVGIGMQAAVGNLGGIISSYVYLSKDSPRFIQGHAILIGLLAMAFGLSSFMTIYLRRENSRRDRVLAEQGISHVNFPVTMKIEHREEGDDAIFFRYTV